jgi:tetratricopeptide (TPR) repeat protein
MNPVCRIGFILAAMLLVVSFTGVPAIAQQDEAAALHKRVLELYQAGKFSEAIPLAERVLAIREKAFGPDHPEIATVLNSLAVLYTAQGRYAEAEPLLKRSLAIREKVLGSGQPNFAQSLNSLAVLYRDQGRYADAESLHKRALAIFWSVDSEAATRLTTSTFAFMKTDPKLGRAEAPARCDAGLHER